LSLCSHPCDDFMLSSNSYPKPPLKPLNIMCILSESCKRLLDPNMIIRMSKKPSRGPRTTDRRSVRIVVSKDRICSHNKRFLANWEAYILCQINISTKSLIFITIKTLVMATNITRVVRYSTISPPYAILVDAMETRSLRVIGLFLRV
jgi:hypothetical protein